VEPTQLVVDVPSEGELPLLGGATGRFNSRPSLAARDLRPTAACFENPDQVDIVIHRHR
jgi:hypothetical protein